MDNMDRFQCRAMLFNAKKHFFLLRAIAAKGGLVLILAKERDLLAAAVRGRIGRQLLLEGANPCPCSGGGKQPL